MISAIFAKFKFSHTVLAYSSAIGHWLTNPPLLARKTNKSSRERRQINPYVREDLNNVCPLRTIRFPSGLANMSDDSSSEDEITKRLLKDSIDPDLMPNDLYNDSGSRQKPVEEIKKIKNSSSVSSKPSLRYILEDDGHDHNFIKVTPEFQEFVAKHLFKHLENQIIEKKSKQKKYLKDSIEDHPKGIHLFKGSSKLLNSITNEPTINRKRHHKFTSDEVIMQRASETAVTPEWVLKKDSVLGWAKMTKGKIMKVKSNEEGSFDIISD